MLTSEQSIVEYKAGRAYTDRLTQNTHKHYLTYADQMLSIYTEGIGQQRQELHKQVEKLFREETDCPVRRIAAFYKLLDDKGTYQTDPDGKAANLRLQVFSRAADYHPLVQQKDQLFEHAEQEVKEKIALEQKKLWNDIEQNLYADVMEYQRLENFSGYPDAASFLSHYNISQLQAALYRAISMKIRVREDFKTILRYAKLARLLLEIKKIGPSQYDILLSGPVSLLYETRRYGVNFARFLPALLACKGWEMSAALKTSWNQTATLQVSERDGFRSHLPQPEEFDSSVEEAFAKKFGTEREGWKLIREGEILHENQTTFIPDFVFRHQDGTEVLMEIVGFWTPEYLNHKREILRKFKQHNILLAVSESSLSVDAESRENIVAYKKTLMLKPVQEALETIQKKASSKEFAKKQVF